MKRKKKQNHNAKVRLKVVKNVIEENGTKKTETIAKWGKREENTDGQRMDGVEVLERKRVRVSE